MADNSYINFPQLQGYGSFNTASMPFKPLSFSEVVDFINPPSKEYFGAQAREAKDFTKNAGYVNPLQYDIEGTELAGDEPTFSQLAQRMTYDPSDIDNVDYFGRTLEPDLSYGPEDLYSGKPPEDTSFLNWLEKNAKKYGPNILKAATKKSSKQAQPQNPSISPRGSAASYAPPGRLGSGPYTPVNPRPDYQGLAQNAFRNALVNYILNNPKQNVKGLL